MNYRELILALRQVRNEIIPGPHDSVVAEIEDSL